jgi:hypothetical protein
VVSTTLSSLQILKQRPINQFSPLDEAQPKVLLVESSLAELQKYLPISEQRIASLLASPHPRYELASMNELPLNVRENALRAFIFPSDLRIAIVKVEPVGGHIMSDRGFMLRVHFAYGSLNPPRMVTVTVVWAGESFIVETYVTANDLKQSYIDIVFDERQVLPIGSATFSIQLFTALGSLATSWISAAVLPSNPFSLLLGPNNEYVTGTWSARGVRHGDAYDTGIAVTLMNGEGNDVSVNSGFHWRFWDGGVGGSLIEEGDGDFNVPINVPAFGTWSGWISFHSPSGSGVYNLYNNREDMTIEIVMTRGFGGGSISGSITARTMFLFGVNVTKVAGEDFTSQEYSDLFAAATVTRTIYERKDISFNTDSRYIPLADVGLYEIIESFQEFHNLCSDWSGPNSNNNIDAFIVQTISIAGTGIDGIDGSIPGPTSHDGPNSGLVASKCGYVDSSGVRRLSSAYLGMLIGHELGHYLGLNHVSDAGNLMLPSSGTNDTNLNYDQYRIMIQHGWVAID